MRWKYALMLLLVSLAIVGALHFDRDGDSAPQSIARIPVSVDEELVGVEVSEGRNYIDESAEAEGGDLVEQALPIASHELMPESCASVLEESRTSNKQLQIASFDAQSCEHALLALRNKVAPALPGLSGFDVKDLGEFSPRAQLADEIDVPAWSRGMENQIYQNIPTIVDFPMNSLNVVCRSSMCGVLFSYNNASYSGGKRNIFARQLADALGFSGYESGEQYQRGYGFTYIYLGDWDTQRPETSDEVSPTNFEGLLDARNGGKVDGPQP